MKQTDIIAILLSIPASLQGSIQIHLIMSLCRSGQANFSSGFAWMETDWLLAILEMPLMLPLYPYLKVGWFYFYYCKFQLFKIASCL